MLVTTDLISANDVFFVISIREGELTHEFCPKAGGIKNFFWLKLSRGLPIIETKVIIAVVVN